MIDNYKVGYMHMDGKLAIDYINDYNRQTKSVYNNNIISSGWWSSYWLVVDVANSN